MTAPSISGVSTTPEDVADVPITPCTKSGTYAIVPNIAIPTRPMQATLAETVRSRSRSNGRIGSGTRRSISAKSASSAVLAASAPSTCPDVQAY